MRYFIFLVGTLVLGLLAPINLASADPAYDCLEKSKGRLICWDSRWQSDKLDDNVIYMIKKASLKVSPPNKVLTLTLMTKENAKKKQRSFEVTTVTGARNTCDRLVDVISLDDSFKSEDPSDLPYIWYSRGGWVRGYPPEEGQLSVCTIKGQRFSCLVTDKDRFGRYLKDVETRPRY